MNQIQCTWITYIDGKKVIRYYLDPVEDDKTIDTVSYPKLSSQEVEEVKHATIDRVQKILSKHF